MTKNINKKKAIEFLLQMIKHDFGFYNPIWKWSLLPPEIKENYLLLEPKLLEWQQKGHIKIIKQNGEIMLEIISVPKN